MKRLSVLAAVVLVVLMVHAWGGSAAGVSPLASCNADCTGLADGEQVADPYNCTAFFVCIDGGTVGPFYCDPGNFFDPTDPAGCVVLPEGGCESACGAANCPLTCNGTVTGIGSAFDCNIYYYCTPEGPSPAQTCPDDQPYYNGNTFSCSSDESVCCSGYCTPYCYGSGFAQVPDPTSCSEYYICYEEGDVDESLHGQCPQGEIFNVSYGACRPDTGEPCLTLCDASGGGGGTSITTTTSTTTTSGGGGGGDSTTPGDGSSTDINGCVSSLECTAAGNFPACSTCQPEYFQCSGAGAMGVLDSCTDDTVFNPTPGYPYCVLPSNCPYP